MKICALLVTADNGRRKYIPLQAAKESESNSEIFRKSNLGLQEHYYCIVVSSNLSINFVAQFSTNQLKNFNLFSALNVIFKTGM